MCKKLFLTPYTGNNALSPEGTLSTRPKVLILNWPREFSRVAKTRLTVTVRLASDEQSSLARDKALNLYCRALLRLYRRDTGGSEYGKGVDIL